jgi:hypothetical protein
LDNNKERKEERKKSMKERKERHSASIRIKQWELGRNAHHPHPPPSSTSG